MYNRNTNNNDDHYINSLPLDVIKDVLVPMLKSSDILALNATCRFFRNSLTNKIRNKALSSCGDDLRSMLIQLTRQYPHTQIDYFKIMLFGNTNSNKKAIFEKMRPDPYQYDGSETHIDFSHIHSALRVGVVNTIDTRLWQRCHNDLTDARVLAFVVNSNEIDVEGELLSCIDSATNNEDNYVKLVLINTTKSNTELSPERFEQIANSMKGRLGEDLVIKAVNSTSGVGIREAFNIAIARTLQKIQQHRRGQAVMAQNNPTNTTCLVM